MKDASYWVEKIRNKEITIEEYYQEIDRKVKEINPQMNGLIEWDFDVVKKSIQEFSLDNTKAFGGLPIPLKMLQQEKAGWKITYGSSLFSKVYSNRTSNFVKRLETIGFVPTGQTNTPEFGLKTITDSILYGPARNPWNLEYSTGGSSGGAAAVVASGIFPIAAASDGAGSIRIPAAFTGLIGLKPTRGMMPTGPGTYRDWQGAAINFALTVSMRDTETLFYALKENAKAAPYHPPYSSLQEGITRPLKIAYYIESPIHTKVSKEAIIAVENSITELQKLGHEVTKIEFPIDGVTLLKEFYKVICSEVASMLEHTQGKIKRKLTSKDMEAMTWLLYQYGKKITAISYSNALQYWDTASERLEELFTSYDLLLSPTVADVAPKIKEDFLNEEIKEKIKDAETLEEKELAKVIYEAAVKMFALTPYTFLANASGQPAISLPTHISKEGLPLGIQFMASKSREDLLFTIGKHLEEQKLFKLPKIYYE